MANNKTVIVTGASQGIDAAVVQSLLERGYNVVADPCRVVADRSQFFKDLSIPFYGYNWPDAKVSQGVRDAFWLQGMQVSIAGAYECIKAFSETDFTEDLKIGVPTLILHSDADQIKLCQSQIRRFYLQSS